MADTEKIDVGPCEVNWGESDPEDLGQTSGDLTVSLDAETQEITTEQEGLVDEVLLEHMNEITVPLAYTDKETLSKVMPWATLVEGTEDESKLEIPKKVNEQLSEYADLLNLHPLAQGDSLDFDINVMKCYPVPGPINLTYSRTGQRVAEVTFKALENSDGVMTTIGDPEITSS
ncbi:MAG: hypothetical protein ACOC2F_04510 [Bacteroidota bacterium]